MAHRRTSVVLLTSLLLVGTAQAVKVCVPSNPFPPLTFPEHVGQGQWLARRATEQAGGTVQFESVPWPRCLKGATDGDYDAAMPPTGARSVQLAIPLKSDGTPDESKAIGDANLVVVRRVGSKAQWDGKRFSGLNGAVMFNRGIVAVREKLEALGAQGDEGAQPNESLLQKLVMGRAELLIMNGSAALTDLADPAYAGRLEILPEPFIGITGYLGFNKTYQASNRVFVDAVWAGIVRLRNSPEFRAAAPALAK
jgi:polar amino acid transport system substrate-binding protein